MGFYVCFYIVLPSQIMFEKHLVTFFPTKYFGIFHLKMQIILIFRSNYLT